MPDEPFVLASAHSLVGREIAVSGWFEVTQDHIDRFADVTDDHQWIHQEGSAARAGPFGAPIAHGLLLLSLTTKLARESGVFPIDARSCLIYGYDRIRFQRPVRTGGRVRCRTTILGVDELGPRVMLTVRFTVDVEGETLPALVADCRLLATA
jgi:acyl dehydratase